jgi:molybdenum cofactor cytidylyltransferase
MPRVAALILAAGGSSRMASPKQLLQFQGRSLVRHAVDICIAAGCEPVRVVIGSSPELMKKELAGAPVDIIENPNWAKGMGTSIRAGMASFSKSADAVMILLCDQPLITAEHLRILIAAYERSGKPLCACSYPDNTIGPPAIFDQSFFSQLQTLHDQAGAKAILASNASALTTVKIPAAAVDLDTPEDFDRLRRSTSQ